MKELQIEILLQDSDFRYDIVTIYILSSFIYKDKMQLNHILEVMR